MIRRAIRLGVRLGFLAGIGLALFKLVKGRRSAFEYGSPSADWAPAPVPNPNLPKTPPEPELVQPVMFEELIEKKAAVRAAPPEPPAPGPTAEAAPSPVVAALAGELAVKKSPAKKAAAKKAASPVPPAAAGPVEKVPPPKTAAAKKAPAADKAAPVAAKNAAPARKAPKKAN